MAKSWHVWRWDGTDWSITTTDLLQRDALILVQSFNSRRNDDGFYAMAIDGQIPELPFTD
ncbi:MAG: hypothetical protein ABW007_02505 [Chitinophagaceae bacterium]